MIESKKINIIAIIAVCVALVITALIIGFGDSEAAKEARQAEYITELFGDEIISVDILADSETWSAMLENAQAKEYIMADVAINGVTYQNVGVRTKGNASLTQVSGTDSPERYSLRLKFDEYIKGQTCLCLDELVLNNLITDATYMKEYMSLDVMRYIGVDAPLTNYASISVNGEAFGLYVALESYGESYNGRVYEDNTGNYYNVKTMQMGGGARGDMPGGVPPEGMLEGGVPPEGMPEGGGPPEGMPEGGPPEGMRGGPPPEWNGEAPQGGPPGQGEMPADGERSFNAPGTADWNDRAGFVGMGGGSRGGTLEYTDDELSSYPAIFENASGSVSNSDQRKVVAALKNLSTGTDLERYFDVDAILRYFAAHTVVVNLDSYYSNMAQNYFIYERDGQVSILPWDYHLSYGGFQAGSAEDVVNFPIDTPVSGVEMESRPLLNMLLSNEEYLARYHGYLQEIVDGYFNSGLFEETARALQTKLAEYVKDDPSAFYTYDEFNAGVDALILLNRLRADSITGQLNGTIPATTEGQQADASALTDASALDMSALGSNQMGGPGGGGGPGAPGASRPI